ncbi:MAG: hypothetical protein QF862_05885 [Prochlorococcaceae cyanobacterium ETNP7_MAG_30]|nr:hypothetical protein [Prochlorococcaceae cyanobacterium ETNP7_MAG_30]
MKRILALSLMGLGSLAPLLAMPSQAQASPEKAHVKIFNYDLEDLYDVKAVKDGSLYDVKIIVDENCDSNSNICLHSVRAYIDGKETPIKAIKNEGGGRLSIKAITELGKIVDVKGIDNNGNKIDVKGLLANNSLIHNVKAIHADDSISPVKGYDKDGKLYHIKVLTASENVANSVNGVEYIGDVKAISIN